MNQCWKRVVRKAAAFSSAGLLLQANGCMLEPDLLGEGLLTSIMEVLISQIVFGAFNLPVTGF